MHLLGPIFRHKNHPVGNAVTCAVVIAMHFKTGIMRALSMTLKRAEREPEKHAHYKRRSCQSGGFKIVCRFFSWHSCNFNESFFEKKFFFNFQKINRRVFKKLIRWHE